MLKDVLGFVQAVDPAPLGVVGEGGDAGRIGDGGVVAVQGVRAGDAVAAFLGAGAGLLTQLRLPRLS
jgi:hypothetical protein